MNRYMVKVKYIDHPLQTHHVDGWLEALALSTKVITEGDRERSDGTVDKLKYVTIERKDAE